MAVIEELHNQPGTYLVYCPGCKFLHQIPTKTGPQIWQFDGNMTFPTFSPSLLVRYPWGENREQRVCHSFIRNGIWNFLGDCTHELRGKSVPMVDVDTEEDYE